MSDNTNKSDTNKSDSQPPSRSESVDGSGFSDAQEGLDEDSLGGRRPRPRSIYNLPSMGYSEREPVGLTNLTPTKEEVYINNNPAPQIQSHFMQIFPPSRQHVGYPFLFAPANPNIHGINPESYEFRKLMLKKQERESKKPKNVRSEFKF